MKLKRILWQMTDEELAEAYYNSRFKSNESHFSKSDLEQAFLAGLKEGRERVQRQMMSELGDAMQTWGW